MRRKLQKILKYDVRINEDLNWEKVSNAIIKVVAKCIVELKLLKNPWYNDVYRTAIERRHRKVRND